MTDTEPASAAAKDRQERKDRGVMQGFAASGVTAFAAVAVALIGGGGGGFALGQKQAAGSQTPGPAATVTVTPPAATQTVTQTVTVTVPARGVAADAPTRRGTGLKLGIYESFDLDSTARDWGKSTSITDGSNAGNDLLLTQFGAGGLAVPDQRAVRVSGTPDPAKCTDPTAATVTGYIYAGNEQGKSFCYRTNENRVVWLTVKTLATPTYIVTVDVLVWRDPQP